MGLSGVEKTVVLILYCILFGFDLICIRFVLLDFERESLDVGLLGVEKTYTDCRLAEKKGRLKF